MICMRRKAAGPVAGAVLACLQSTLSMAADNAGVDPVAQVFVTAARIPQPVSDVIGSVSVITRADIQRHQAQSVQELLRGQTGISIANNGGLGKISSMFVRGAEADQVLVLVDGVRVGSATAGTTRIEFIPVDQIERIEIVRGPRSSLYGSDAIGGVVQIFTTRASGPTVAAGGGSNGTHNASASFGQHSDSSWFSIGGSYQESDGYNSCRGSLTAGCFTNEPDDDGFRTASGSLRAGYRWGKAADVEASALYASGNSEYDGSFGNETDFKESVIAVKGHIAPTASWDVTLLLGNSRDEGDDASNGVFVSTFDTEKRHASLQSDWKLARDQVASLGVDYIDDRVDSTTTYDVTARDNIGTFAQYKGRFGAHEALVSARYDDNEQFGGHTTGNLGWKWFITDDLALSAGWGSAFLAPNFNDLYYPGFSNPDLKPEQSNSYEMGIAGTAKPVTWSVSAFQTQIDDLIAFDFTTFLPQNISKARIRGVEAEARTRLDAWSFVVGYTGLDPRNRDAGANFDNLLPRRPRQSGHVDVEYASGAFSLGTIIDVQGSRFDSVANTEKLGGYTLVDLIGELNIGNGWSVQGKIANAFDRDYETARFFRQERRSYFVTLRYQPVQR